MIAAPAAPSGLGVRGWFDLARAGNFPSVGSNVLASLALSSTGDAIPPAGTLAIAVLAGILVYAGGATFNDVADAEFDRRHRPERAIPRGLVSRGTAAGVAAAEMAAGLALLIAAGASAVWAAALAATILLYDWIHKRWSGAVILMAGCRVLLAVTLASLPGHELTTPFLAWAAALFIYIVTLSLIARREYQVAVSPVTAGNTNVSAGRAARLGRMVGRLLAFIPLIDAVALLLMGLWGPALACALAVPAGRWAQRLAASN
ncbi:MAG: UbiA family prenyltransferase [Opitutaceae bacterium]|nr:UbiA family prenyltransferase [Opitutaceae bacterium]